MTTSIQDSATLEQLIDKAREVKDALDGIGEARDAAEAIERAIRRARETGEPGLLDALESLGEVIGLAKKWAPEGVSSFFEAYAAALKAIAGALKAIPLTPYDRALDRAFDEAGDLAEAIKLADRMLPDAPPADRERAIKRIKTRLQRAALKKQGYHAPKRWYEWDWLPWNWFSTSLGPRGAVAPAALVLAVVLLTGACEYFLSADDAAPGAPPVDAAEAGDHSLVHLPAAREPRDGGQQVIPSILARPRPVTAGPSGLDLFGGSPAPTPDDPAPAPQVLGPIKLCPGEKRSFVLGPYLSNVTAGPTSSNAAVASAGVTGGAGDRDVSDTITITGHKPGTATISLTAEQWVLNPMGSGTANPQSVGNWRTGDLDILVEVKDCGKKHPQPEPPGMPADGGPGSPAADPPAPAPGPSVPTPCEDCPGATGEGSSSGCDAPSGDKPCNGTGTPAGDCQGDESGCVVPGPADPQGGCYGPSGGCDAPSGDEPCSGTGGGTGCGGSTDDAGERCEGHAGCDPGTCGDCQDAPHEASHCGDCYSDTKTGPIEEPAGGTTSEPGPNRGLEDQPVLPAEGTIDTAPSDDAGAGRSTQAGGFTGAAGTR